MDEVGLAHEAVEPRGATCSGGGMMNRMKAARSKARGREKLSGGSLKMTCNKMEMTGVEELELRRVVEMRQERTKQRRRTGESDESSEMWRWDGRALWYKVECKGVFEFASEAQGVQSGEYGFGTGI